MSLIGRTRTPGLCMSMSRKLIPSCLGTLGVGAHQAEHPVGLVGVRGPDLLPVDHVARRRRGRRASRGWPGPIRRRARCSPGTSGSRPRAMRGRCSRFCSSVPKRRSTGPSIHSPRLFSGGRQPRRAAPRRGSPPRRGERPPPPYSVGQVGAVSPRAAMRSSHTFASRSAKTARRPPQTSFASPAIGRRIEGGQLSSIQPRISRRKRSRSSLTRAPKEPGRDRARRPRSCPPARRRSCGAPSRRGCRARRRRTSRPRACAKRRNDE